MSTNERCYILIDSSPQQLRAWRKHIALPSHPDQLTAEDLYAAAHPLLDRVKRALVERGWGEITPEAGARWTIVSPAPAPPLAAVIEEEEEDGEEAETSTVTAVPISPIQATHKFSVPTDLSSLGAHPAVWRDMFTNEVLFRAVIHPEFGMILESDADPLLVDIAYVLQLLLPGFLTIVTERLDPERFSTKETRPFPPLAWMERETRYLVPIFGEVYWNVLRMRSRDGNSMLDFLD